MKHALLRPGLWVTLLVLLVVLWKGPQWTAPSVPVTAPMAASTSPGDTVERGRYLARIGNCAFCHTARGGDPYGGGRAIDTPFGAIYSSNLTPDKASGIGKWTADDFWRAMHHGVSRDDRLLYPAFPYPSYSRITREDSDALWAFLQTVPPSIRSNLPPDLPWPISTQSALWAWRTLYFRAGEPGRPEGLAAPSAPADTLRWERGAYLTEGLGHCFECHASRNGLGGVTAAGQGNVLPGSRWYAPSLLDRREASVADWSEAEVVQFLTAGASAKGQASGPMAEVVLHGTQYLTAGDALAMASYLRSLPAPSAASSTAGLPASAPTAPELGAVVRLGASLYTTHCASCHGDQGEGQTGVYPALAANRSVTMGMTHNLVQSVLRGGFAPATAANPRPYGMPPFMITLSDAEVAAVLTYVRQAWGNSAAPLGQFDITQVRR